MQPDFDYISIGAVVMLVPLVAWTISQAKGKYRTYYDVLVSTTVFIMLAITVSVLIIMTGDRIVHSKMYTRHSFYEYPEKIDQLPPDSKIMNLAGRSQNYSLYGASHLNRVVSHLDAIGSLLAVTWNSVGIWIGKRSRLISP